MIYFSKHYLYHFLDYKIDTITLDTFSVDRESYTEFSLERRIIEDFGIKKMNTFIPITLGCIFYLSRNSTPFIIVDVLDNDIIRYTTLSEEDLVIMKLIVK